jgi:hypothetical protein
MGNDDFQWWITTIPDRIAELKQVLPATIAGRLDRSVESLGVLERFLLDTYTGEQMRLPEHSDLCDRLATYIGSTLNRNIKNAEWYLELEDRDDVYFNIPVLIIRGAESPPVCPLSLVSMVFHENGGAYLTSVARHFQPIET